MTALTEYQPTLHWAEAAAPWYYVKWRDVEKKKPFLLTVQETLTLST